MSLSPSQKRWGAGVIAFILAAGGMIGAYVVAKSHRQAAVAGRPAGTAPQEFTIRVTAKTCEPNVLRVPAGKITFRIVNQSSRVLEWEIVKGVIVVEERENIAPGLTQALTATLQPGDYEVTCGLVGNPRGKLEVTNSGGTTVSPPVKPTLVELIGPMAEYKVYVSNEAGELVGATQELAAAVKAGDLARAQALYAPAHAHYGHIEPVAELFARLDRTIDSENKAGNGNEEDGEFTGFHRLRYGLFAKRSTICLESFVDQLSADVAVLQSRIQTRSIPPAKLVGGAATLLGALAATEEGRSENADPADELAKLEGVRKIVSLLRPLTARADPELSRRVDAALATATAELARYGRTADGSASPEAPGAAEQTAWQGQITGLAQDVSKLHETLGLN